MAYKKRNNYEELDKLLLALWKASVKSMNRKTVSPAGHTPQQIGIWNSSDAQMQGRTPYPGSLVASLARFFVMVISDPSLCIS